MSDHHEYVHDCECHDCLRVTVRKRNAELTEVKAQRDDLIAELAIIRKVVSDCSFALGTGAFLTSGASISIMRELPSEIRKTVVMLKAHAFMADEDADALRARLQSTPAPVAQKMPGSAYTFPGDMLDAIERLLMFCDENDEVCNGAVTRRQIQRMRFMLAAAQAQEGK